MFPRVAVVLILVVGGSAEALAQEKAKERTGTVGGKLKARKEATNRRSVTLEILAPGEEKARSYLLSYNPRDPKAKERYTELLALVDAATIGDQVECGWVNSPEGAEGGFFVTSFRVVKKATPSVAKPAEGEGPTEGELTELINRLIELDSIDLAPKVGFRAGLEPSLYSLEGDESGMTALKDPYARFGEGKPGAAGWYRLSFVVPEKIGKFAVPKSGYNLGIESNVLGAWEIYTYKNGKPHGLWSKEGMNKAVDQHATAWMSNAPQPAKPGDQFTVAILGLASPLGRGSPEGYGLRHLRLRFAWGHTGGRQPFYGSVYAPGQGTGLLGAREMLRTKKGDELKALQEKLRGPIARLDAVFAAAETGQIDNLTKAMLAASKEVNDALKK